MSPARSLLFAIYIPSFLLTVGQQAIMLLLPLYILDLSGGMGFAAVVVGLRGLGMMLIDIPAGMLTSRFGDNLATTLSYAFVQDKVQLMLITVLYGLGSGAWLTARLSYITAACSPSVRGRAVAGLAGTRRLGALLGPALGGFLAHVSGYAAAFVAAGLLALAAMVMVAVFAGRRTQHAHDATPHLDRLLQVVAANRRAFLTAGSGALSIALVRSARRLLVPLFGAALGIDTAAIGLIYSLSMGLELVMFYPAGLIMDRWGRRWTAVPCVALLSLALVLLPLAGGFTGLLLVALLAGLGNGLGTGAVMTMGTDLAPLARRGEFLGVWRLISDVGLTGGPLIIGAFTTLGTLAAAAFAAAGIGAAGMILLLVTGETAHGNAASHQNQ
jgi:MFS family permease